MIKELDHNSALDVADLLNDSLSLVSALQAMQFDDLNEQAARGVGLLLLALADKLEAVRALAE